MAIRTLSPRDGEPYRIIPLVPNWDAPVKESIEFKTDIITSFDGKEQRRSLRRNPRRSFEFTSDVWGMGKSILDAYMNSSLAKIIGLLPDPTHATRLLSPMLPVTSGTQSAFLRDPLPDANVNDYVIFDLGDGNMEALRITSLANDNKNLNLADITSTVMPAGTRVYLARKGRLRDRPQTIRITKSVARVSVQFDFDIGTGNPVLGGGASNIGWREGFMRKPNWKGGVSLDNVWERQTVDYGFGKTYDYVPINFPARVTKFQYLGKNYSEVREARDFFIRHMGRRKEFIVPTWENDVPFSYIASNSRSILVEGEWFANAYADTTVFKRIIIAMKDGSYHHRQVDSVEYLEDTNTSVLRTRTDLPGVSLTDATIFGISWGLVSRFASDKMEIDWVTSGVGEFSLAIQSLENFDI